MTAIAIIHHLSSSGGTVFSKCIAAQPNVVLLSEVHPLIGRHEPIFMPFDPLVHLLVNYPEIGPSESEMNSLFLTRLEPVVRACERNGRKLVLRDHSHSDYLTDRSPRPRLAELLAEHYELQRIVTFRNPIDAYLSMQSSGFDTYLTGFDDYCQRALKFLDDHKGLPLWTYEKFVSSPQKVIEDMCARIGITFDAAFQERFCSVRLTGDSGRRPDKIQPLERRSYSADFMRSVESSKAAGAIASRLGHDSQQFFFC
ncbi:hypothetical protein [Hyphomicrobium sp.]|uniref:hypothetical protein n=1 Tax=Hyphomicrobium sp. TaxID=82 RepID=UPI001DC623B1|nr:hypothetical protein [Hyphomicrobium sp.]MBY0559341.1 hypothetical protein [Hyphomicrobium sp.]